MPAVPTEAKNIADVAVRVREVLELGTAALQPSSAFATSTQGGLADTAVQPATLTAGLDAFTEKSFINKDVAASRDLTAYSEVEVRRWSAASRLCKTTYQKVTSQPSHPFKFQDTAGNWFELADREIDPVAVGAKGDWNGSSGTDDGPILSSLFNSGFKARITRKHAVANTITVTAPCEIELALGSGLYWQRPVNSVAASLLVLDDNAVASQVYGLGVIDGREDVIHATNPVDPFHGSLVRVKADRCRISGIMVRRSWDNGIGIGATAFSGHPFAVVCEGVRTEYCGLGTHTNPETPGHAGGGIDVASGVGCAISNHIDLYSASAIILDLGAGANCSVTNCVGYYNETTYYFGASDSQISNIKSFFASGTPQAIWVDQPNIRLTNVMVYACEKNGMLIKGSDVTVDGYAFKSVGYGAENTYAGVLIDAGDGDGSGPLNVAISSLAPMGATHRASVKTIGSRNMEVGVQSLVPLTGATASFEIGNPGIHQITKYDKAA